jgi:hypothetical protein
MENFLEERIRGDKAEGTVDGHLVESLIRRRGSTGGDGLSDQAKLKELIKRLTRADMEQFLSEEKTNLVVRLKYIYKNFYECTDRTRQPNFDNLKPENLREQAFKPNKSNFDSRKKVTYSSRLLANRPYFYRIEPIIHRHIRKLFASGDKPDAGLVSSVLNMIAEEIIIEIFKNPKL